MNWVPLKNSTRKALIVMMIRTTRPLQLTGASVITMSLETFVKVCILVFFFITDSFIYQYIFIDYVSDNQIGLFRLQLIKYNSMISR